jgi:hypothetical protein
MKTANAALAHPDLERQNRATRLLAVLGLVVLLAACRTASPYDARAYEYATSTKAEALRLIDKAGTPASRHRRAIDTLRLNLDRAYEFSRGLPKNDEATAQWAILRDPDGHSLGGFITRWQRDGRLDPAFVAEAKRLVAAGFDELIALESGKPR